MATVGIRDLKNRLTYFLRLTRKGEEIIVTDRGEPIALIQSIEQAPISRQKESRLAQLAAQGKVILPTAPRRKRLKPVSYRGPSLADAILEDRDRSL
jgi:prevent-host-death family protein